jgi:L-asparaginase II
MHLVAIAVVDIDGNTRLSIGDIRRPRFLRSAAKPFVTASLVAHGAAKRLGWTPAEIALASASHAGEPEHILGVRSILEKAGLPEVALRCGAHAPKDEAAAAHLIRAGLRPSALHNNCSGQHAAMASVANEFTTEIDYLDPAHPVHDIYEKVLRSELDPDLSVVAVDGCGLPTHAVSLIALAKGFARLANPEGASKAFAPALTIVRDAMTSNPYFVGGRSSLDSAIMLADSSVVSKHGAEAVYAAGFRGRGLGIALKILDGSSRAIPHVLQAVLPQLQLLSKEMERALSTFSGPILNAAGKSVGEFEARGFKQVALGGSPAS